jgi:hypothetical protein
MKETIEKLKAVVLELEKEHGPLLIFALFLREDPIEKWDIVVSASWLSLSDLNAYRIVASKVQEALKGPELMQFSRVVILDDKDPVVAFLQEGYSIKNGHFEELSGDSFSEKFKFAIKRAYLLRCQKII